MELRQEREELLKEQGELEMLLGSPARQRTRLKRDLAALRKDYAEDTALGRRRTTIAEAAPAVEFSMDAMIEKEPVTVILSQRGWIRAARGHLPLEQDWKFKEGDGPGVRASTRRPPTSCCSPPTTGASSPSAPTSCPARAGSASRSATRSTSTPRRRSSR